jgi:hypothetical protein
MQQQCPHCAAPVFLDDAATVGTAANCPMCGKRLAVQLVYEVEPEPEPPAVPEWMSASAYAAADKHVPVHSRPGQGRSARSSHDWTESLAAFLWIAIPSLGVAGLVLAAVTVVWPPALAFFFPLGGLAFLGGTIVIAVLAFREDTATGLTVLFVPFCAMRFCNRDAEAYQAWIFRGLGIVLIVVGGIFLRVYDGRGGTPLVALFGSSPRAPAQRPSPAPAEPGAPAEPERRPPARPAKPELPQIIAALRGKEVEQRRVAMRELATLAVDEERRVEVAQALEVVLADPSNIVRADAVRLLGTWGNADNVPALEALIDRNDFVVRIPVFEALGKIKGERAIKILTARLEDQQLRFWASSALRAVGPDAEPAVLEVLEKGKLPAQKEAIRILQDIGTKQSIPLLTRAARSNDFFLSTSAKHALAAIQRRN